MTLKVFKAPLWLSFALLLGCSTVEVKEVCKDIREGNVACVLIKEKK
jgi:hypothetical protein